MTNHELHNTLQSVLQYMHKLSVAQDAIVTMLQEQEQQIHKLGAKMSKELDALKAAVDTNSAALNDNTAAVEAAVTALGNVNTPPVDNAAIQSAADALTAQTAIMKANTDKLNAALVPATPPVA